MCKGRCFQQQWKIKAGSISDAGSTAVRVYPRDDTETWAEAEARAQGVPRPDAGERMAAIRRVVRENTAGTNEKCTGDHCACLFPSWGEWLPVDGRDAQNRPVEKWADMLVYAPFERSGIRFRVQGWVKVKTREITGKCIRTVFEHKASFIPEWDLDLNDERLEGLTDESLALLREKFA